MNAILILLITATYETEYIKMHVYYAVCVCVYLDVAWKI